MATTPLVSVIVPAYNAECFLGDAVQSVLRQTWTQLELIIVNDGSSDGTGELADRLAAADHRAQVIHKENGGPSSARNAGIAVARGDAFCFLDADDIFLPDKLERQLAFLELFSSCDLVYSDHYVGDAALTPLSLECKRPPPIRMQELLAYRNWFAPMAALARARLLTRVGPFDESLRSAEDWDFWVRAASCGALAYLPGPVGVYRTHPDQAHRNWARMRRYQEEVIRKHYAPGSREWHIAYAVRAWKQAKRCWAAGTYVPMAAGLARCVWHARSRRALKNVFNLPE